MIVTYEDDIKFIDWLLENDIYHYNKGCLEANKEEGGVNRACHIGTYKEKQEPCVFWGIYGPLRPINKDKVYHYPKDEKKILNTLGLGGHKVISKNYNI